MADPASALTPPVAEPLGAFAGSGDVELDADDCDMDDLADVEHLDLGGGVLYESSAEGGRSCFGDGAGAFVVESAARRRAGWSPSAAPYPFTNEGLGRGRRRRARRRPAGAGARGHPGRLPRPGRPGRWPPRRRGRDPDRPRARPGRCWPCSSSASPSAPTSGSGPGGPAARWPSPCPPRSPAPSWSPPWASCWPRSGTPSGPPVSCGTTCAGRLGRRLGLAPDASLDDLVAAAERAGADPDGSGPCWPAARSTDGDALTALARDIDMTRREILHEQH